MDKLAELFKDNRQPLGQRLAGGGAYDTRMQQLEFAGVWVFGGYDGVSGAQAARVYAHDNGPGPGLGHLYSSRLAIILSSISKLA